MGRRPELGAFRKFRRLNTLRLLEMQSELVDKEEDFEIEWQIDSESSCPVSRSYQYDWESLESSKGDRGTRQRDTWRALRDKLEAYSGCCGWPGVPITDTLLDSALLQQIQLCTHEGPSKHDLQLLRQFLWSEDGNFSALRGRGAHVWTVEHGFTDNTDDFVVLSPKHRQLDHFTRLVSDQFLKLFHLAIGRRLKVFGPLDRTAQPLC